MSWRVFNMFGVSEPPQQSTTTPQQGTNTTLGPQGQSQGGSAGSNQFMPQTQTQINFPISGQYQVNGVLYGAGLTADEYEELRELDREYEITKKKSKLEFFKTINSELRQFIINSFEAETTLNDMNNHSVNRSPRHVELEMRQGPTLKTYYNQSNYHNTASYGLTGKWLSLPEGITLEELKIAHVEASLEEEMLDE